MPPLGLYRNGPGRPPVILMLRKLVVRMALENPLWGYDRIESEIKKLGHQVSPTTVHNIHPSCARGWHHAQSETDEPRFRQVV